MASWVLQWMGYDEVGFSTSHFWLPQTYRVDLWCATCMVLIGGFGSQSPLSVGLIGSSSNAHAYLSPILLRLSITPIGCCCCCCGESSLEGERMFLALIVFADPGCLAMV